MKFTKLAQKSLLTLGISTILSSGLLAQTIDVSKSTKDIRVMARIIETSLESSAKTFPGRPRIEGTYLAEQGYLFSIQLNGIGAFGIPGLASWDRGRLELDIPELIGEALSSIDSFDSFYNIVPPIPPESPEPEIASSEADEKNEQLKQKLRDLRDKQRETRSDIYQLRREIRRVEEDSKRKQLEQKLAEFRDVLKQYSNEYKSEMKSYKNERILRKIKKSTDAVNAVFTTICDYGQSLRALKKDEKFTLMLKGGVDENGKKATQVYVMKQKALKNCSNSQTLKKNAIHYTL